MKAMHGTSVVTLLSAVCICFLYYLFGEDTLLTLAITFTTIAYHFNFRLLIGGIFNGIMHNRADYTKKWYQVSDNEMAFYKKIKIKKWKSKMPTYDTDAFDITKHSWDEIIQTTCQSELVHEANVLFCFLPVLASIWVGAFEVFIVTSTVSALLDLMFVFMQRFNRGRMMRMKGRKS